MTSNFWFGLAFSLVLGAAGGFAFFLLGLPLPWMLGSMVVTLIAALLRWPIVSARPLRTPLICVIGVTLGSAFYPSLFDHALHWLPITIALFASPISVTLVAQVYFTRIAGFDPITAYFASMPGGVYEMVVQGGQAGGDERSIALVQAVRIFLVVVLVPIGFRIFFGSGSTSALSLGHGGALAPGDIALLLGCALIGWPLARLLRLPNPALLGPLLLSATAHLTGITNVSPPPALIAAVQVVLGVSIGGQFIGAEARVALRTLMHGAVVFPAILAVCTVIALAASLFVDVDLPVIILSLAPGGMTEMSLVALTLHADVALVTLHQLLRMISIQGLAGLVYGLVKGRMRPAKDPD